MASLVDRISALPDDVLYHVLRFLPVHDVVRTCVLARRWRGIWWSAPALRFTGDKGWDSADSFVQFVYHLLDLWSAGAGPPLNSCDFDLDSDGFLPFRGNEQDASYWIWQAAPLVRALRLRVVEFGQSRCRLSDLPLVSQHLTRLELVGVGVNYNIVDLSGCPALEELNMEDCDVFGHQLLSPSLKHLRLARCTTSWSYRILISLPTLVTLELIELQRGRVPLLGSLPGLARAVVVLNKDCSDQCSNGRFDECYGESETCDGCYFYYSDSRYGARGDRHNSIFLKGLSQATDLQLSADSNVIVFNRDLSWCPKFTKLKTLLLNDWCLAADHNALICFLQHSPILEKLTLQLCKAPPNVVETEGTYKPVGQSVASNCLKIVEIKCVSVDRRVHKIINILTTYGIPLEQININHTSRIS